MAGNVRIDVSLSGVDGVTRGMNQVSSSLTTLAGKAEAVGKKLESAGRGLQSIGTRLTLGVTTPIVGAAAALFKFSSEAIETQNLFEVSMGRMVNSARDFTNAMSKSFGLNRVELQRQLGDFYNMTTAMGLGEVAAYDLSKGIVRLTQDLASFRNVSPEEAFLKLRSVITGETEPLRAFGIDISENTIKMALFKKGLIEGSEQLSTQQKILGRYLVVLDQTKNAQGDLARTIDSPANQFRVMNQTIRQLAIDFGMQLMPVFQTGLILLNKLSTVVADAIKWFSQLSPQMKGLVVIGAGLIAVLGPILSIMAQLTIVAGGLFTVLAAGATPLWAFVAAVTASAAGAYMLSESWGGLVKSFEYYFNILKIAILDVSQFVVEKLYNSWIGLLPGMSETFIGVVGDIMAARDKLQAEQKELGADSANILSGFNDAVSGVVEKVKSLKDTLMNFGGELFSEEAASKVKKQTDDALMTVLGFTEEMEKAFKAGGAQTADNIKKQIDAVMKLHDTARKIAQDQMALDIRSGQKTLEDRVELLRVQLQELVKEQEEELKKTGLTEKQKLAIKQDYAQKEIELRGRIADTYDDMADRDVKAVEKATEKNLKVRNEELEALKARYQTEGDLATGAQKRIQEAIGETKTKIESADEAIMKSLTDTEFHALSVAQSMHRAFQKFFYDTFSGSASFAVGIRSLFKGLADAILEEFARIAASEVFRILFGAGPSAGLAVGQQVLSQSGGGLLSGAISGGIGQSIGSSIMGGGGGLIGSLLGAGGTGLTDAFALGGAKLVSDFGGDLMSIGMGAQIGGFIGTYLGPIVGGITQLIQGNIKGAIASTALGIIGTMIGGPIGGIFGSLLGGLFATGGSRVVTSPTLFGAGEMGNPERITVTPLGGSASGGGVTIIVQGSLIADEIGMAEFVRRIEQQQQRENRRTIA